MTAKSFHEFRNEASKIWFGYVTEDRTQFKYPLAKITNKFNCFAPHIEVEEVLNANVNKRAQELGISTQTIYKSFSQGKRDPKRFHQFNEISTAISTVNSLFDLFNLHALSIKVLEENSKDGSRQNINNRCKQLITLTDNYLKRIIKERHQEIVHSSGKMGEFPTTLSNNEENSEKTYGVSEVTIQAMREKHQDLFENNVGYVGFSNSTKSSTEIIQEMQEESKQHDREFYFRHYLFNLTMIEREAEHNKVNVTALIEAANKTLPKDALAKHEAQATERNKYHQTHIEQLLEENKEAYKHLSEDQQKYVDAYLSVQYYEKLDEEQCQALDKTYDVLVNNSSKLKPSSLFPFK